MLKSKNEQTCQMTAKKDDDALELAFIGRLSLDNIENIWRKSLNLFESQECVLLRVNLSEVTYCDSGCAALFWNLRHLSLKKGIHFELTKDTHQPLISLITELDDVSDYFEKKKIKNFFSIIGKQTISLFRSTKENLIFVGKLSNDLLESALSPKKNYYKNVWKQIEMIGPDAFPIIALIGILFGFIMSFQSSVAMSRFGADIYVANMVGISLFRELGPIMTAIVLTGRSASAFTAEIGTMKVNQEIDALITMNINPIKYLIFPRMLACIVMAPLLTMCMLFFGLVGCGIVMESIGFSFSVYYAQLKTALSMDMLLGAIIKSIIFGVFISAIGCIQGIRTHYNPTDVGRRTTTSVVSCIIMIAVIDGIISLIFHVIGY
jgi:phospholipid/cholesterol/gamma-HCH transport system permease protein